MRFGVFTVMKMQAVVFWTETTMSLHGVTTHKTTP